MNTSHLLMMSAAIATALPSIAVPLPPKTTHTKATYNQVRFNDLAQQCSNSGFHPNTLQAIARVESGFNPYAIGVVKGKLQRQPRTHAEAVATAKSLHAQGKNFSMGLMQVNRYNLAHYGLNYETVFEPCKNINAGAKILKACFDRAGGDSQTALKKAFSCYYSGNFRFGFKSDFKGQPPYVTKIIMSALDNSPHQAIRFLGSSKASYTASVSPSTQQINKQPEIYVPMPQVAQNTQNVPSVPVSTSTDDQSQSSVAVAQKKQPPPPEWDIFAYNEYHNITPEWDAFQGK